MLFKEFLIPFSLKNYGNLIVFYEDCLLCFNVRFHFCIARVLLPVSSLIFFHNVELFRFQRYQLALSTSSYKRNCVEG